ncbi:MAG: hypothetical protein K8W52_35175 [Deltaproteobacteria bacterium]|nr:hypothetical protein [Deltaproteobacteria bacterium]
MRWIVIIGATAACAARPPAPGDHCTARWSIDHLEQRDALTSTWDASSVEPMPLWTGDLDHDGLDDVILRYRGSRVRATIALRRCDKTRWEVVLDEVPATRIGTAAGADGWLDLVFVDRGREREYHHGPTGYQPSSATSDDHLGDDPEWQ